MLKTQSIAIGILIGVSVASTLSASTRYPNQPQYGQGGGYQQDQRSDSRTRSQRMPQTKNYPVPQGYNGSQPFSYDMPNVQRQRQGQSGTQPSQNNQKDSMQRMQCPTLTRPEFTALLTKGSVSKDGMTLKKASSNTGGTRKKLQGFFGMKQENTYPGSFIPQAQLDRVVKSRGIKIDSMAMSSGGLEHLNRGFCLYTHKPGGESEDLAAAIIQGGLGREQRSEQTVERSPQQVRQPQMGVGSQGEVDDRQAIKNLAGKTVGYYRPGDKPRFWKSLTKDEKSLVNDLKAKNDNGEPLNQEEQKVYKDVEKILNLPEGNVQQRPMPRQNRNPWGNSYGD